MPDPDFLDIIKRSSSLPALPQVLLKLLEACNSLDVSNEKLADIISSDPSLSIKLLQLASSAYYSPRNSIKSIIGAVQYLGQDTIKNIALSVSVMQVFRVQGKSSFFSMDKFWSNSFLCGSIAKKLGAVTGYPYPEEAFLAGLINGIGILILAERFPEEYGSVYSPDADTNELASREKERFDTTHMEIGAWLTSQWNINPLISDSIRYMGETTERVSEAFPLVRIVYASKLLSRDADNPEHLLDALGFTGIDIDALAESSRAESEEFCKSIGIDVLPGDPQNPQMDEVHENALFAKVKTISMLHGTLQNLLSARDRKEVLAHVDDGLHILLGITNICHFLFDETKNILSGFCVSGKGNENILSSIAVPMSSRTSLIAGCISGKEPLCSLTPGSVPAISDEQITRILGCDGIYVLPMTASETSIGVLVLGINRDEIQLIEESCDILMMLSNQAALCIHTHNLRKKQEYNLLQEKMQAVSTISRKVVHEINNPLFIVKNYMKILSNRLPDLHPAQEELVVIREEMGRVSQLITQLSSFSQPEMGDKTDVDLNELLSGIFELINSSILQPKGIDAIFKAGPGIPKIKTDPGSLKQIIINLLKNSSEALESGGQLKLVTGVVKSSGKILIDERRKIPEAAEIVLKDNGPGIPDDIKKRLFEPYNSSKGAENSGLGLSIVHGLVQNLGGKITCKSSRNTGTEFVITLPMNTGKRTLF